jgi:hypothetical protein
VFPGCGVLLISLISMVMFAFAILSSVPGVLGFVQIDMILGLEFDIRMFNVQLIIAQVCRFPLLLAATDDVVCR